MCDVLVTTGEVYHDAIDLDLPGHPPFEFKRSYSSTNDRIGALGQSWDHNWQNSLEFNDKLFRMKNPLEGDTVFERAECDGKAGPNVVISEDGKQIDFKFKDGSSKRFRRIGPTYLLTRILDAYQNESLLEYQNGFLTKLTDSSGRSVVFRYRDALLISIEMQHQSVRLKLAYEYDNLARLVKCIDPHGFAHQFDYEGSLIVKHTNKVGNQRFFCYDQQRRCIRNWYDSATKYRSLDFSPDSKIVILTDSLGLRDVYRLNDKGSEQFQIDPLGRQLEWVYDDSGGLLCKLLQDGSPPTVSTWDEEKGVRTSTDLRGAQTKYHFDEDGEISTIENALGDCLTFERDARGKITKLEGPENAIWKFEFGKKGELIKVIDPEEFWLARSEEAGRVKVWDALGPRGEFLFDCLGNLMKESDELGRTTTYEYEGQDLPILMTRPDGSETRWTYDPALRIASVTDGLGRTTKFVYDVFSTVVKTIYPDGRTTQLHVDSEGRVREIENGKQEKVTRHYDVGYRQHQILFPDGRRDLYGFDSRDRVVELTNGRGETMRFDYDEADNPVEIQFHDGAIQSLIHDEMERLIAMSYEPPAGSKEKPRSAEFAYTGNHIIELEKTDELVVHFKHDRCGRILQIDDSRGSRIQFDSDGRRRTTQMTDNGRVYNFFYSPAGELIQIDLPNGMCQKFHYDVCSRLTRREVFSKDGTMVAWRDFEYDAADQVTKTNDWRLGTRNFSYDLGGRLIRVADDTVTLESYTYDLEGNMLSSPVFGQHSYTNGNRLDQTDNVSYKFDGCGCLTSTDDGTSKTTFEYGLYNQISRISEDGTIVADYVYDLMGRRTLKITPSDRIEYFYHVNNLRSLVSQRDGTWTFTYAPDSLVPLAQTNGNNDYFYSFDQLGTPTEVWGEQGNLVATIESTAFGANRVVAQLSEASIPVPFHFSGQIVDEESPLFYNRFRYYSPHTARFTTQDPFGLRAGLNLYLYPTNPMNWIDPLGLTATGPLMLDCALKSRAFTPCEQWAAQQKMDAINSSSKDRRKKTCSKCRENKQKRYFEKTCGGSPTKGQQVDHLLELQLGGADLCCGNLMAIPSSVNQSFGSQVKNAIKEIAMGDAVPQFEFNPPGCDQAHKCSAADREKTVSKGTKDDGKDCEKADGAKQCS